MDIIMMSQIPSMGSKSEEYRREIEGFKEVPIKALPFVP
jgi:hypothetical protein